MQLYPVNQNGSTGAYNLSSLLHGGKNSVLIYKGSSPGTTTTLAIKIFTKQKGMSPSPHYLQEEAIACNLNHPNILKYFAFYPEAQYKQIRGPMRDCSAVIMEYVPHGDLFSLVTKRSLSEKLARTFFRQMVSAVAYLHEKGIAHLDLKPENFLIGPEGLKLIDFDFSHRVDGPLTEGMRGTPGYRPPEFARGFLKDLKAADIYSLGITLFTMVSGCPPYDEIEQEKDVFIFDKFYDALRTDPKMFWNTHNGFRTEEGKEEYSNEFKELIMSLLAEEAKDRPSIEVIKENSWYKGEVYDQNELEAELRDIFQSMN